MIVHLLEGGHPSTATAGRKDIHAPGVGSGNYVRSDVKQVNTAVSELKNGWSGASVNWHGGSPKDGYMVAMNKEAETIFPLDTNDIPGLKAKVAEFRAKWHDTLSQPGKHLGLWVDHESNKVYIDIATNVKDLEKAKTYGKQYHEIAIWDIKKGEEIRL